MVQLKGFECNGNIKQYNLISIPHGTIKSFTTKAGELHAPISIPHGTIKRWMILQLLTRSISFQYLMVQLKVYDQWL